MQAGSWFESVLVHCLWSSLSASRWRLLATPIQFTMSSASSGFHWSCLRLLLLSLSARQLWLLADHFRIPISSVGRWTASAGRLIDWTGRQIVSAARQVVSTGRQITSFLNFWLQVGIVAAASPKTQVVDSALQEPRPSCLTAHWRPSIWWFSPPKLLVFGRWRGLQLAGLQKVRSGHRLWLLWSSGSAWLSSRSLIHHKLPSSAASQRLAYRWKGATGLSPPW